MREQHPTITQQAIFLNTFKSLIGVPSHAKTTLVTTTDVQVTKFNG